MTNRLLPSFRGAKRSLLATCLLAVWPCVASADPGDGIVEVQVSRARLTVADVVRGATGPAGEIDLGRSPVPGGTRVLTREEIAAAIAEAGQGAGASSIPETIRVVRKMMTLDANAVEKVARDAIGARGLWRGVTLSAVRAPKSVKVADGWDRVEVDISKPPRKKGNHSTRARLTFFQGGEMLTQTAVPIDLALTEEAMVPDVKKGSPVTIVVKRGLVEVTTSAIAQTDADIGSIFPVQLRGSGRVLRVSLQSNGQALVVDDAVLPRGM